MKVVALESSTAKTVSEPGVPLYSATGTKRSLVLVLSSNAPLVVTLLMSYQLLPSVLYSQSPSVALLEPSVLMAIPAKLSLSSSLNRLFMIEVTVAPDGELVSSSTALSVPFPLKLGASFSPVTVTEMVFPPLLPPSPSVTVRDRLWAFSPVAELDW